jgi:hypothetical protein
MMGNNMYEFRLLINSNWDDTIDAELMYAVVDDLNSGPDWHQVRVVVNYHY